MENNLVNAFNAEEIFKTYEDQKKYAIECLDKFNKARENLNKYSTFYGAYADGLSELSRVSNIQEREVLSRLNKSAWKFTYDKLNIEHIAPNTHLKEFKNFLENPVEYTPENVFSIFKDYVQNPREMALKAFAEIFNQLDPFYKSHDNFRVGVKGLPKRVIIKTYRYSDVGWCKILDIINVISRFRNIFDLCYDTYALEDYIIKNKQFNAEYNDDYRGGCYKKLDNTTQGLKFKYFANGNVHIYFDKERLDLINSCLAEYYGEVLPDAYEHTEKKQSSKEVSKDLQFYRTPENAVNRLLSDIYIKDTDLILEPSCGDGALLDGIYNKNRNKDNILGIEFDLSRCLQSREKGYTVLNDNFLTYKTDKRFDKIIMNPPFYGKHYFKHIEKAYELLSKGGELWSILPVTAIDHGLIQKYKPSIHHLPIGSFRESGTNINTIYIRIRKLD